MQRIENANLRLPRSIQDLKHVRNTIICFCNSLQVIPYFASLGNEVVVRIDHEKRSDLFVKLQVCHVLSSHAFTRSFAHVGCLLSDWSRLIARSLAREKDLGDNPLAVFELLRRCHRTLSRSTTIAASRRPTPYTA